MKKVRLSPMYDRDAYGLWFFDYKDRQSYVGKKTEIEMVPISDGHLLPEPTLIISREDIQQLYKSFVEQMEMNGEPVTEFQRVIKAKDENLKDLRNINERLLNALLAPKLLVNHDPT